MIKQTVFKLSPKRRGCHLITSEIMSGIPQQLPETGLLNLFVQHTSCALTINENADPDVVRDMLLGLDRAYPDRPEFRHAEGNSAAHLKCSAMGVSKTIPFEDGNMLLGIWQGIYFCEFDGPRTRNYYVKVIEG